MEKQDSYLWEGGYAINRKLAGCGVRLEGSVIEKNPSVQHISHHAEIPSSEGCNAGGAKLLEVTGTIYAV